MTKKKPLCGRLFAKVAGRQCENLCGYGFEAGDSFETAGGDTEFPDGGSNLIPCSVV